MRKLTYQNETVGTLSYNVALELGIENNVVLVDIPEEVHSFGKGITAKTRSMTRDIMENVRKTDERKKMERTAKEKLNAIKALEKKIVGMINQKYALSKNPDRKREVLKMNVAIVKAKNYLETLQKEHETLCWAMR